jgi:membrane-bound serine protease (ClpP class)
MMTIEPTDHNEARIFSKRTGLASAFIIASVIMASSLLIAEASGPFEEPLIIANQPRSDAVPGNSPNASSSPALTKIVVILVSIAGQVTPASDDMIAEAIKEAESENAAALLIELDTPGGGLQETLEIIAGMERTKIPVIAYVSPSGAKAWSAGTLILMAADVAAMAPGTIIGSAQPVKLSPTGGSEPVNDSKTLNAIVALIEEKARMHGRNVSAARKFVDANLNLNAEAALGFGSIDLVCEDIPSLLKNASGRTAKNTTLMTDGAVVRRYEPDLRLRLLQILSDPMIAGLLMLIGLYALIFGLSNAGTGAELFGVVALALGLIGQGFDVDIGAVFLILIGLGLLVAELHAHTLGLLSAAGMICIVAGSLLLAPVRFPEWYMPAQAQRSAAGFFLVPSLIMAGFFALAVYKIAEARLCPTFEQEMAEDRTATAVETLNPKGYVLYHGEYWEAVADARIEKGAEVLVVSRKGRTLQVKRR